MTKVDFMEWRSHPVTQEMMRMFGEVREAMADRIINGDTLGKEMITAKDIGVIKGLDYFLNAEFEDTE